MPPKLSFPTYILPSNFLSSRRRKSSVTPTVPDLSSSPTSAAGTSPQTPSFLAGATNTIACSRCHVDFALTSQIISKGFTGRHGRAYLVAASSATSPFTPPPPAQAQARARSPSTSQSPGPQEIEEETSSSDDGVPLSPTSPRPVRTRRAPSSSKPEAVLPNTYPHRPVNRNLVTGAHIVSDIACAQCHNVIGWRYIAAEEEGQKYKVGKYILEARRTSIASCWDASSVPRSATIDADRSWWDSADNKKAASRVEEEEIEVWGGDVTGILEEDEDVMFDSQDEDECEALFAGMWTPGFARDMRARRLGM